VSCLARSVGRYGPEALKRPGVPGINAQDFGVLRPGLRPATKHFKQFGQAHARRNVVRIQLDGLLKPASRFGHLPQRDVRFGKIEEITCRERSALFRIHEVSDGLGETLFPPLDEREYCIGRRILRHCFDGAFKESACPFKVVVANFNLGKRDQCAILLSEVSKRSFKMFSRSFRLPERKQSGTHPSVQPRTFRMNFLANAKESHRILVSPLIRQRNASRIKNGGTDSMRHHVRKGFVRHVERLVLEVSERQLQLIGTIIFAELRERLDERAGRPSVQGGEDAAPFKYFARFIGAAKLEEYFAQATKRKGFIGCEFVRTPECGYGIFRATASGQRFAESQVYHGAVRSLRQRSFIELKHFLIAAAQFQGSAEHVPPFEAIGLEFDGTAVGDDGSIEHLVRMEDVSEYSPCFG